MYLEKNSLLRPFVSVPRLALFPTFELLSLKEFAPLLVGISIMCNYIINRLTLWFPLMSRTPLLDFPMTYRNASVLCQSECACLHKTVIMVVFFTKNNENTNPKGRALMQMYRVVPIRKGKCGDLIVVVFSHNLVIFWECVQASAS